MPSAFEGETVSLIEQILFEEDSPKFTKSADIVSFTELINSYCYDEKNKETEDLKNRLI